MKRFAEQFNKKAGTIKMKAAERRELHDRLLSYMEYHPLPSEMRTEKEAKKTTKLEGILSEPFLAIHIDLSYLRAAVSTLAVLFIVVVPFVAEKSLPGDVLYPVKVQFNEELRSTLSLSSYAKVEWETERLERRIAEARLLANEGKLTDEVEEDVAKAVKEHTNKAKQGIAAIRESDSDEADIAEIAFASALEVQSEVLEGHIKGEAVGADDGHTVGVLASAVAEAHKEADAVQANNKPSYEKLLARVEMETTLAYELFSTVADYASAEEVSDIERRLADIERKINEAITIHDLPQEEPVEAVEVAEKVEEEVTEEEDSVSSTTDETSVDNIEAEAEIVEEPEVIEEVKPVTVADPLKLLREALAGTQKLISFMTDIDVRETVSIEELVPVTLTDDEKIFSINNTLAEVNIRRVELEKQSVSTDYAEKFALGVEKLESLVVAAEDDRFTGDYDSALSKLKEVNLILDDLFAATAESTGEVVIPEPEVGTSTNEVATGTEEVLGEANSSDDAVVE